MYVERRTALKAIGASLLLPAMLFPDEKSLPMGEVPKEILDALEEARKSIIFMFSKKNTQIVGEHSAFFVKHEGKKILATAGHCVKEGYKNAIAHPTMHFFGIAADTGKSHKSEKSDAAILETTGFDDAPELELLEREVVEGEDVYIMEPKGIRFMDQVRRDGEITFMDDEGMPPLRTTAEKVGEDHIRIENYMLPGSSGTPLLVYDEGKMKAAGVYIGFSPTQEIKNGEFVNDTDGIAVKINEIRKLLKNL